MTGHCGRTLEKYLWELEARGYAIEAPDGRWRPSGLGIRRKGERGRFAGVDVPRVLAMMGPGPGDNRLRPRRAAHDIRPGGLDVDQSGGIER